MGSCFTSEAGSTSSRNSQKDKASQKGKENNKPKYDVKKQNVSPITVDSQPAPNPLEIKIITKQVVTKPIKVSEDKPYVYVQPDDELTK